MITSTTPPAIDLRPGGIERLFHPFDPAPLPRRALATDAMAYVRDRLAELPSAAPLRLVVHLPVDELVHGDAVRQAVHLAFAKAASHARDRFRSHWVRSVLAFIAAILFGLLLIVAAERLAEATGSDLMHRVAGAVTIVIWVILWRPCEMILFDWIDLRRTVRAFDRLESTEVACCEAGKPLVGRE